MVVACERTDLGPNIQNIQMGMRPLAFSISSRMKHKEQIGIQGNIQPFVWAFAVPFLRRESSPEVEPSVGLRALENVLVHVWVGSRGPSQCPRWDVAPLLGPPSHPHCGAGLL